MAELLSHVLLAFVVLTIVSWRVEWLTRRWIAVGMVGAVFPDLEQVDVFVPDSTVQTVFGVPFDWGALTTLGGVILLSGFAATTFSSERWRAFGVLAAGGLLHLLTDGLKTQADGRAEPWLYPITWYRHPTPNLYISSDTRVLGIVLAVTIAVVLLDRHVVSTAGSSASRE